MNHPDLPFGRYLCDQFSRTFRVRRKQPARRHPAMTRVVETPDGLARIETIVKPPKKGTSMAGLSVPSRHSAKRMPASFRASATAAVALPRLAAILVAHSCSPCVFGV